MRINDIRILDKHKAVLNDETRIHLLEGVTGSSKSLIAGIAFFFKVFKSDKGKSQFVIAASSISTAEKMFIDNPASFYNLFKDMCEYKKNGTGGARIEIRTKDEVKKIYLVGYDDRARYKSILGLTIHGFLVEEVQITHDEFIRELFTRVFRDNGFLYATANAGLPDQVVYTDYFNKARPHPDFVNDVPVETLKELETKDSDHNYRYWWFGFKDNPTLTAEQIKELYNSHPVGSFQYNSKILAIRGYVEGLLYNRFIDNIYIDKNNDNGHNVKFSDIKHTIAFDKVYVGIDIGSNAKTVFVISGITRKHQRVVVLDSYEVKGDVDYNGIVEQFNNWFLPYYSLYNTTIKSIRPDAADSLFIKTLRNNLTFKLIEVIPSYKATIQERVSMKEQLLHQNRLLFSDLPGAQKVKNALTKIKSDGKGGHLDEGKPETDYSDALDYSLTPAIHELMSFKFRG